MNAGSSLDIQSWFAIAQGNKDMPPSFQRFLAAWELVVAWHREHHPEEMTDKKLRERLVAKLKDLDEDEPLELDTHNFRRWEVVQMAGRLPTPTSHRMAHEADWQGLVDMLYTIRCNLLKGGKSPINPRDLDLTYDAADVTVEIAQRLHNF